MVTILREVSKRQICSATGTNVWTTWASLFLSGHAKIRQITTYGSTKTSFDFDCAACRVEIGTRLMFLIWSSKPGPSEVLVIMVSHWDAQSQQVCYNCRHKRCFQAERRCRTTTSIWAFCTAICLILQQCPDGTRVEKHIWTGQYGSCVSERPWSHLRTQKINTLRYIARKDDV